MGRLTGEETPEELSKKAIERCLGFLMHFDRTEHQLRVKLKEGGFPPLAIDEAIRYAAGFHYIDDERYASQYLELNAGRKSIRQIRYELEKKGISAERISNLFEETEHTEDEALYYLFKKYRRGRDLTDSKEQERILRYLCGKGFSYEAVRRVIKDALSKL